MPWVCVFSFGWSFHCIWTFNKRPIGCKCSINVQNNACNSHMLMLMHKFINETMKMWYLFRRNVYRVWLCTFALTFFFFKFIIRVRLICIHNCYSYILQFHWHSGIVLNWYIVYTEYRCTVQWRLMIAICFLCSHCVKKKKHTCHNVDLQFRSFLDSSKLFKRWHTKCRPCS